jgi:hypothetical protein
MDKTATALPVKLASPAQRALSGAGITCLQDLTSFHEKEIRELHGIGPNALKQIQIAMELKGIKFMPDG